MMRFLDMETSSMMPRSASMPDLFPPSVLASVGDSHGVTDLVEVLHGVLVGAIIAVPLAIVGILVSAREKMGGSRWYRPLEHAIGRFPTLLSTFVVGWTLLGFSVEESPYFWGFVAILCSIPVIWRVSSSALAGLPDGLLEAAVGLGMSRLRALWLVARAVVGLALSGSAILGIGRALVEGWILHQLRVDGVRAWPDGGVTLRLILIVTVLTLVGSILLGLSQRRSRSIQQTSQ